MKKLSVLFLLIIVLVSYNCSDQETKFLTTTDKINLALPQNFNAGMSIMMESIIQGIQQRSSPSEQLDKSLDHLQDIYCLNDEYIEDLQGEGC